VARAEAYAHAMFHLDPSYRLATLHQRYRQDRQRSDSMGANRFTNFRPKTTQAWHRWKAVGRYRKLVERLETEGLLANVNWRSRSQYNAVARPSVVCNVRAPYSGGCHFRQYFYGFWYVGHALTSTRNFTEIVPREPFRRGS